VDEQLPEGTDAIVVGGGFPEMMAEQLSANTRLLAEVRSRIAAGLCVWAECGGLLWLCRSLDGHPMAGVLPADGAMTDRLSLGYRTAECRVATPLGLAGTRLRGHEFHYSRIEPAGEALDVRGLLGGGQAGFATPSLLASYVHVHLAGQSHLAEAFVRSASAARRAATPPPTSSWREGGGRSSPNSS
jgi:cobyrinic acid a,c-diamide synthase